MEHSIIDPVFGSWTVWEACVVSNWIGEIILMFYFEINLFKAELKKNNDGLTWFQFLTT